MRRLGVAVLLVALATSCTPAPPVVTAPATPAHPDFMFPAAPPGTAPSTLDRLERGWRLLQRDDAPAAEREFTTLLRADRAFVPALTAQGYAALVRRLAPDALTSFDTALAATSLYAPALVGRGLALLEAGRDDEALVSFEAALAAEPSAPTLAGRVEALRVRQSQDRVSRAERAAADRRWDEARDAYRAAIAASPDSAFLYRDLATVERRAGNVDAALQEARRAVVVDAEDARAHVLVAELLADRTDFEGALAAYRRAAALDPSAALERAMAGVRDRAREAALPAEFHAIGDAVEATRADVAALLGVRITELLARAPQRQVVVTDVRTHWASSWIQASVRAGVMDVFSNYTFQPSTGVRRGDLADIVSRVVTIIDGAAARPENPPSAGAVVIADVSPTHLAFAAVRRAVDSGVMRLDNGAFGLLDPVSGRQAVEVVDRLASYAESRR